MAIGAIGLAVSLPFINMTLFSSFSAFAIVLNVYLSTKYLGERLVPKYDLTATTLIVIGSIIITILSNK